MVRTRIGLKAGLWVSGGAPTRREAQARAFIISSVVAAPYLSRFLERLGVEEHEQW